jgi:hypothetical protein
MLDFPAKVKARRAGWARGPVAGGERDVAQVPAGSESRSGHIWSDRGVAARSRGAPLEGAGSWRDAP